MIKFQILNVLIKILGIYSLINSINYVAFFLEPFLISQYASKTILDFTYLLTAVPFILYLAVGVLLIVFSSPISNTLFSKENDKKEIRLTSIDFEPIIFSAVGIYILINSLSKIAQISSNAVMMNKASQEIGLKIQISIKASLISFSLELVLGVSLVIFSIKISKLLNRLRINQNDINN